MGWPGLHIVCGRSNNETGLPCLFIVPMVTKFSALWKMSMHTLYVGGHQWIYWTYCGCVRIAIIIFFPDSCWMSTMHNIEEKCFTLDVLMYSPSSDREMKLLILLGFVILYLIFGSLIDLADPNSCCFYKTMNFLVWNLSVNCFSNLTLCDRLQHGCRSMEEKRYYKHSKSRHVWPCW